MHTCASYKYRYCNSLLFCFYRTFCHDQTDFFPPQFDTHQSHVSPQKCLQFVTHSFKQPIAT